MGRPKGYTPYVEITYGELGDWVGRKSRIKVSRAWLEDLTGESIIESTPTFSPEPDDSCFSSLKHLTSERDDAKIDFKLTDLNNE